MVRGKNILKGLLHQFFELKFILRILGRPVRSIHFFRVLSLPAPVLVKSKGLLTSAGPKNAQNYDFFMDTKTGSDLKIFDQIEKIHSGNPV